MLAVSEGMNKTQQLRDLGQSLWLDNITRKMLDDGSLRHTIEEFSVTGLTSNPTIFDEAIGNSEAYDQGIREKAGAGKSGEALFIELALEDLRRAADLFRSIFDSTDRVDGWVSMEVSPLLAADTAGSIAAAAQIHAQAHRPNLFAKIPGTPEGIPAIEESIFAGVPINVTLLFSRETLRAYAEHGAQRGAMAADGGDAEAVLARFAQAGIDVGALALQLQRDGAEAFVKSWKELLERIAAKSAVLAGTGKEHA